MDTTASYTGKNDGVWLLWGIFEEYLKQNIITAVLRTEDAHSVVICRLIKKKNNVNKNRSNSPRRNIDSNFDYEVLVIRNLM